MKKSELRQLVKEQLRSYLKEATNLKNRKNWEKIDRVIISYSKSGNRILELPQGMTWESLTKWLNKNKAELDKKFPVK